jgi:hypothetical protein
MAEIREDQVVLVGRLGYPKLFEPKPVKQEPDGKKRYGCQIYLPKSDEETKARIEQIMRGLIKSKLKGVAPKSRDLCIRDGDGEDGTPETEGFWVISANRAESQGRPTVLDTNKTPLSKDDTRPYAGCWCQFLISIYVPSGWNRIAASLEIVRFYKDDEAFGAPPADPDVMPDLPDDADDDGGDSSFAL